MIKNNTEKTERFREYEGMYLSTYIFNLHSKLVNSKNMVERVKRFKGVQSLCSMFDGASLIRLQQHKDPTLSIVSEPLAGQLLRIHKLAC